MNDSAILPAPEPNRWVVAGAVMLSSFMVFLDTSVVNVSLPYIAGSLSASIDESTWALTSYLVANAIVLPLTGWLANHFGRKRLLLSSVAGFTTASFLCGLAPNLPLLILFRVIQGFTGGALQPISQAVLLEAFKPEERGRAMGFWGLGIVVAPILGPVVGGWLIVMVTSANEAVQGGLEIVHRNTIGPVPVRWVKVAFGVEASGLNVPVPPL